jgi:DNA-binding NarL/FixJ family response regulator
MGHAQLQVAIVAAEAGSRRALTSATRACGHRVVLPADAAQLRSCDVAIVAGEVARELLAIRRSAPELPVVAVLPSVDRRAVSMLLREGVAGLVGEAALEATLAATILAVASGQLCIPRTYAAQAAQPQLSTREKQILGMVVLGFANLEIAQQLVVAESTVKSHLSSAFRKLGVRTRVEAATLILDPANGLGTGILTIPTAASDSVS